MKKTIKTIIALVLVFVLAFTFVACDKGNDDPTETGKPSESTDPSGGALGGKVAQGITDAKILVGNTATTSGAYAFIGKPFSDAMTATFEDFNKKVDLGEAKYGKRKIEYKSYDDGFNAANGVTLTEKLVESDKIFALVGHFGTPTVGATVDYIQDIGIPMVYAATGINALRSEGNAGNPIMPVQPIYYTEGEMMLARLIKEKETFGEVNKIGLVMINDDAGKGIAEGVEAMAKQLNVSDKIVKIEAASTAQVSDFATVATRLKKEGADAVIFAGIAGQFLWYYMGMMSSNYEAPVLVSYGCAIPDYVKKEAYTEKRPVYANAWLDSLNAKYAGEAEEYANVIMNSSLAEDLKVNYVANPYALAGYVAAKVFIEGVFRLNENGDVFNWKNFIQRMEESPVKIPMGGYVDFGGGKRVGVTSMALMKNGYMEYEGENFYSFWPCLDMADLADVLKK